MDDAIDTAPVGWLMNSSRRGAESAVLAELYSVPRVPMLLWLSLSAAAVACCWWLGFLDMGRADGGGEGWGGVLACLSTLPALFAIALGIRLMKRPLRSRLRVISAVGALVLCTAPCALMAWVLVDHERSLQRHAGAWWASQRGQR